MLASRGGCDTGMDKKNKERGNPERTVTGQLFTINALLASTLATLKRIEGGETTACCRGCVKLELMLANATKSGNRSQDANILYLFLNANVKVIS